MRSTTPKRQAWACLPPGCPPGGAPGKASPLVRQEPAVSPASLRVSVTLDRLQGPCWFKIKTPVRALGPAKEGAGGGSSLPLPRDPTQLVRTQAQLGLHSLGMNRTEAETQAPPPQGHGVPCLWLVCLPIHQLSPGCEWLMTNGCRYPSVHAPPSPRPTAPQPVPTTARPPPGPSFSYQHPPALLRASGRECHSHRPGRLRTWPTPCDLLHPEPQSKSGSPLQATPGKGQRPPRSSTLPPPHPGFCPNLGPSQAEEFPVPRTRVGNSDRESRRLQKRQDPKGQPL